MKLAFALFHYFPYGGLERDMLTIARTCNNRGHDITIYCGGWEGDKPADMRVIELPIRAASNHGRAQEFAARLHEALREQPFDAVVGFNKMPGLDVYYAADVCFAQKAFEQRNFFYRLTPRCRQYMALENAVFGEHSRTEILMISKPQMETYRRYYPAAQARAHLLPPGIRRSCIPAADYVTQREQLRRQFQIPHEAIQLLFVASNYRLKGLDCALRGIAAISEPLRQRVRLLVVGQDKAAPFQHLARTLGIENQVTFLGPRDDIPELMWASDALIHPAYREAAGLVLLEAMVAALPVIASRICGHAHYIQEFNMGAVLNDPIKPDVIADAITSIALQPRMGWLERARNTVAKADIFSMPEHATEIIERVAARKRQQPA